MPQRKPRHGGGLTMYCILVTGIPAAGKSTMAALLAEHFGLPVISKDKIKELMYDDIGFRSREEKVRLGIASMNIMYYMAEQLMKSNRPFILENNFEKISKEPLEKILEKYSYTAITVTLTGNYPEIYRRFVERNNSPDRHRGHVVNDGYPEKNPGGPVCPVPSEDFVKGITDRGMDRFAANGPNITVDTTDFEKVRIERVIRLKNVPDGPFFNRQFCVGTPQNCYDRSRKITYAIFRRGRSKSAPTWREK